MTRYRFRLVPALGLVLLVASSSACRTTSNSSTEGTDAVDTVPTTSFEPAQPTLAGVPETFVVGPISGGNGQVILGTDVFDGSASGYTEAEYFIAGTAQSYTSSNPLGDEGKWSVEPNDSTNYTTRIVVRRPSDPARFNGTVFVEWLNVTAGLDIGPVWSYANVEMMRSGAIWVGVSAQRVGIEGGGNPLGETRVLKVADPARYGTLLHPGDNYSYDIFSQAGATVWRNADLLFDGL
ncbi:MAG: putative signal peptide protein, partial [Actinomycetota bacterium]